MKKYLAMDIGCYECGEDSSVIGVYDSEEAAKSAIEAYLEPGARWGKGGRHGQHSEEIFELDL